MPDDIHDILAGFSDEVIAFLEAAGFFDLEGEYNPTEFYSQIPKKAKDEYKAASKEKNSLVWEVVKAVVVGQAIGAGIKQFQKDYPIKFKPSAQDYMNRYVKEHGGEFIKNMGRTDQQKLVNFIYSQIPKKAKDEYKAASKEKNSLVWEVVKAVAVGQAIGAGIKQFQKD